MIAPSIWFLVFIGVVVSGPLLWTSGWWWPRFKKLIRRDNSQRLEQLEAEKAYHDFRHTSAGVKQSLLEARLTKLEDRSDMGKSGQLENILPHIQKCRELLTPFAMPLATIGIGKTDWLGVQKAQFVELVSELGYLARRLDIMGIQSPNLTVEGRRHIRRLQHLYSALEMVFSTVGRSNPARQFRGCTPSSL